MGSSACHEVAARRASWRQGASEGSSERRTLLSQSPRPEDTGRLGDPAPGVRPRAHSLSLTALTRRLRADGDPLAGGWQHLAPLGRVSSLSLAGWRHLSRLPDLTFVIAQCCGLACYPEGLSGSEAIVFGHLHYWSPWLLRRRPSRKFLGPSLSAHSPFSTPWVLPLHTSPRPQAQRASFFGHRENISNSQNLVEGAEGRTAGDGRDTGW